MFTYYECSGSAVEVFLFVLSLNTHDNNGMFLFSLIL